MSNPDYKYALSRRQMHYLRAKRIADIIMSFCCLVVLFLPMLVVAAAVYIDDPGKILFRQQRIGRNGKIFLMYKFRTMKADAPKYRSSSEIAEGKSMLTVLGRFLRKTSVDELPQLFNILKGDMSFVGPRPLIPEEKNIHEMRSMLGIYTIRPGLTGLAQISGRDKLGPIDKVRLDGEYLKAICFRSDLRILAVTVIKVLSASDVSQ